MLWPNVYQRGMAMAGEFDRLHRESLENQKNFGPTRRKRCFVPQWDQVLDDSAALFSRWFVGGRTNTAYNALDRHILDGRGDQVALIYSPVTETVPATPTANCRPGGALCRRLARPWRRLWRPAIYMPMIPRR